MEQPTQNEEKPKSEIVQCLDKLISKNFHAKPDVETVTWSVNLPEDDLHKIFKALLKDLPMKIPGPKAKTQNKLVS